MAKIVWHARAKKLVEVEAPQWHSRTCQPGCYEINKRRADPYNLPLDAAEMGQRPDESDFWYDESMEHLDEQALLAADAPLSQEEIDLRELEEEDDYLLGRTYRLRPRAA